MSSDYPDHLSPELLAAQEKLLLLRAQKGVAVQQRPLPDGRVPGAPQQEFTLKNANQLLEAYRRRDRVSCQSPMILQAARADQLGEIPKSDVIKSHSLATAVSGQVDGIKHYPSIGLAVLDQKLTNVYQVWLICLYLERQQNSHGKINLPDLRLFVREKLGWTSRNLRYVLSSGNGRFWLRDDKDRLFRVGAARLASSLDLGRLAGDPVLLPLDVLVAGRGEFNAHLYAAYHSGRRDARPISQGAVREIAGIPERTQRRYCRVAKVKRQPNFAVGENATKENQQERAWLHGRSCFVFVDSKGRQGKPGGRFVAWRLPNTYGRVHDRAARGRMRKNNRKIADPVNIGTRGNGGSQVVIFHPNGSLAARAYGRDHHHDHFWPATHRKRPSKEAVFWHVLGGQI